jgi:hypothetical protein
MYLDSCPRSGGSLSIWLAFNLPYAVPSWPIYIGGQVSRIGQGPIQITISTYGRNSYSTIITIGPSYMMTHKYRGCIVVLSINKSVEPNEEQKVLMSSFDQGITVILVNRFSRVFGNTSK